MADERRKHNRLARPFEGSYSGASGATRCRINDISLGGCFVHSLSSPGKGESIVVTVTIGSHNLTFPGTVVYADAGMGFAVRFNDIPEQELDELARLLAAFETSKAGA